MHKLAYFITIAAATTTTLASPAFFGFNRDEVGGRSFRAVTDISSTGMVAITGSASAVWNPRDGYVHEIVDSGILRVSKSGDRALIYRGGNSYFWTPQGNSLQSPARTNAMTDDGRFVTGDLQSLDKAFLFNTVTRENLIFGTLAPENAGESAAYDITPDGKRMVGSAWNGTQTNAAMFGADGGITDLGSIDGYTRNTAYSISSNGRYAAGIARNGLNFGAFRWDKETGEMEDLGGRFSSDGINRKAFDVSDDSTVVGSMIVEVDGRGEDLRVATLYTDLDGWRTVEDMLFEDFGILVDPNWHLEETLTISADGSMIGGSGYYQSDNGNRQFTAWAAVIPAPSTSLICIAGLFPLVRRRR